jgi:hypothetical protein
MIATIFQLKKDSHTAVSLKKKVNLKYAQANL